MLTKASVVTLDLESENTRKVLANKDNIKRSKYEKKFTWFDGNNLNEEIVDNEKRIEYDEASERSLDTYFWPSRGSKHYFRELYQHASLYNVAKIEQKNVKDMYLLVVTREDKIGVINAKILDKDEMNEIVNTLNPWDVEGYEPIF